MAASLAFCALAYAQRMAPPCPNPYADFSDAELAALHRGQPTPKPKPAWLPALNERWDTLRQQGAFDAEVLDASAAALVVDELFYDWSDRWDDPGANELWQESLLDTIRDSRWADEQTRAILHDGLLEFYYGGGGRGHQFDMADLAGAILAVADVDDFESIDIARSLYDDALVWAGQAGQSYAVTEIEHSRAKYFGPDGLFADTDADPLRNDAMPEDDAARYRRFRRLVYETRRDRHPTADSLAELSDSLRDVLGHPADASVRSDAVMRICKLYTQMLQRSHGVSAEVVGAIDADLLWLARDSGVLTSERLWQTWGRPAATLGQRASKGMRDFVASPPDTKAESTNSTDTPAGHAGPPRDEALLRARARVLAKVAEAISR